MFGAYLGKVKGEAENILYFLRHGLESFLELATQRKGFGG
ncbi:hypothetical protein SAMN04487958_11910 [Vreelandella subterranea]|uniref:Uncharacterized protein n=1 Tax=Vreelandella subterranea TaxID=416874 RepID=A0A1H9WPV0_9GAMM|nr:hypothetical protein SAMN04487958_11910 [Halomonas subterranea]